jgi:hypothetical protein
MMTLIQVERLESTAAGPAKTSAAALSMIPEEKHPMRVLFFRDHEISGLSLATAPSPVSRPVARGRSAPRYFLLPLIE